jgi:hypothetical protein
MAHEGFAAPVLADVGEQAMLNTVPVRLEDGSKAAAR